MSEDTQDMLALEHVKHVNMRAREQEMHVGT